MLRPGAVDAGRADVLIEGGAQVEGPGWQLKLDRLETVLVPAACGSYQVQPRGPFRALKASV